MNGKSCEENLLEFRLSKKMTQSEIADEIGISRQAYGKLERGDTDLINRQIVRLAEVFGTTPDIILFGETKIDADEALLRKIDTYRAQLSEQADENIRNIKSSDEKIAMLKDSLDAERRTTDVLRLYIREREREEAGSHRAEITMKRYLRQLKKIVEGALQQIPDRQNSD